MSVVHDEAAKATNLANRATQLADEAEEAADVHSERMAAKDAARTARTMRALAHAARQHAYAFSNWKIDKTAEDEAVKATAWALIILESDPATDRVLTYEILKQEIIDRNTDRFHAMTAGALHDLCEELLPIVEEDAQNAQPEV